MGIRMALTAGLALVACSGPAPVTDARGLRDSQPAPSDAADVDAADVDAADVDAAEPRDATPSPDATPPDATPDASPPDATPDASPPDATPPPMGPLQLVLRGADGAPLVASPVGVHRPGYASVTGMTDASGELEVEVSSGSSVTYATVGYLVSVLGAQPGDSLHIGVFNQAPPSGQMTFALPPGPTVMAYSLGGCTRLPQGAISEPCTTQPFTVGFINHRWDPVLNAYVEQFTSVRNVVYVEGGTVQGVGPWIDTPKIRAGWLPLPADLVGNFESVQVLSSGYDVRTVYPWEVANQLVSLPDVGDLVEIVATVSQPSTGRRQNWTFRRPPNSTSLEIGPEVLLPWPDNPVFDASSMTMQWQGDAGAATSVSVNLMYPCARGTCFWATFGPVPADRRLRLPSIATFTGETPTGPITTASLSFMHTSTGWDHQRQRGQKAVRPAALNALTRVHPDFLPANVGRTDFVAAAIINNN